MCSVVISHRIWWAILVGFVSMSGSPLVAQPVEGDAAQTAAIARPGINEILANMRSDHDVLGDPLHRLRKLTDGFTAPPDACVKYREMLTGMEALERDMLQHVHLENNILLPRAKARLPQP